MSKPAGPSAPGASQWYASALLAPLDEKERGELDARYIPRYLVHRAPVTDDLAEEQLVIRIGIGRKLCDYYVRASLTMTDQMREAYQAYPMWGFYVDHTTGGTPKRVYGVSVNTGLGRVTKLLTAACQDADVYERTPIENLTRVDRWTDAQKAMIRARGGAAGLFFDPLAYEWLVGRSHFQQQPKEYLERLLPGGGPGPAKPEVK